MGYNLFAEVTVLPKGYYFCAKGAAGGDERLGSKTLQETSGNTTYCIEIIDIWQK